MTRSIPLDVAIAQAEKSGFLSIEDLQRLASPQPANPAQVTDAIRGIVEDALNSAIPEPWEVAEHATQRILAAIGAGGQAVAKACAICGGPHDNDLLSDICQECESSAPWRDDGQAVAAVELGGKAIRGSQIATETQGLLRDPLQNYVTIEDAFSAIAHPVQQGWREPDKWRSKLNLWFFRDLSDEQRLKLFSLFDLPVDEIGKVHSHQRKALDRCLPVAPQPKGE